MVHTRVNTTCKRILKAGGNELMERQRTTLGAEANLVVWCRKREPGKTTAETKQENSKTLGDRKSHQKNGEVIITALFRSLFPPGMSVRRWEAEDEKWLCCYVMCWWGNWDNKRGKKTHRFLTEVPQRSDCTYCLQNTHKISPKHNITHWSGAKN